MLSPLLLLKHLALGGLLLSGFLFRSVASIEERDGGMEPFEHYLHACSEGELESLEIALEEHPEFVNRQSSMGEGCLHVAAILGQTEITRTALRAGADPNMRSTFKDGLRMTPLSWNVYGGHVETARALLEGGADVNMDFDSMMNRAEAVTVLDILYDVILAVGKDEKTDPDDPHYGKYHKMKHLLLEYGAKRHKDVLASKSEPEL